MKKHSLCWFLFLCIISTSSCNNEDKPNGNNEVAFRVDGKYYRAQDEDFKTQPVISYLSNDTLIVGGNYAVGSEKQSIAFWIYNFAGTGTYDLTKTGQGNFAEFRGDFPILAHTNDNHVGEVTITHYITDRNILSGTFQFTAFDKNSGIAYEITDGYFDITYAE